MKSSVGRNLLSKKSCQESGRGEHACASRRDSFGEQAFAPVDFLDILAVLRFILCTFYAASLISATTVSHGTVTLRSLVRATSPKFSSLPTST